MKAVIDTNVFISALMRGDGANRAILEMCFKGRVRPQMGDALYYEYEDLLCRGYLFAESVLHRDERLMLFDDFCSVCDWVSVHYRWRPNLRDEGDNHIVELAMAANAPIIISWNKDDFKARDLELPDATIMTPPEFLKKERM